MNVTATTLAMLIPILGVLGAFTCGTIASWAGERTKEREAFYRSEVLKKLAESTGEQVERVLDLMREQDVAAERRRREGQRLGGAIVTMAGLGASIMLALLLPHQPLWAVGIVPLLVGGALLAHAYLPATQPS